MSGIFCLLFGVAFILNTHPSGDGIWYWYGTLFRGGQKLYADMHMPLQPSFVLFTALFQWLLGISWLAGKGLALLQLVAYIAGVLLLLRRISWTDLQKALLLAAVFSTNMQASYYRFDDYHITVHVLVLFTMYGLLRVRDAGSPTRVIALGAVLGAFAGIAVMTRINDGAALLVSATLVLLVFAPCKKMLTVLTYLATAFVFCLMIIKGTGDSVYAWADSTIFKAAAIKGGTGRVLMGPLVFPFRLAKHLSAFFSPLMFLCAFSLIGLAALMWQHRSDKVGQRRLTVVTVLTAVVLAAGARPFLRTLRQGGIATQIAELCIFSLYGLALLIACRIVLAHLRSNLRDFASIQLLFVVPFAQLLSGALTSGGTHYEALPPLAAAFLILPIAAPVSINSGWRKHAYLGLLTFMATVTFFGKYYAPYHWHHYKDAQMFSNRVWYKHPAFGPMLIERDQLAVMQSVCAAVHADPSADMLGMPFPYANYFCDRRPWHGYVQTWYDTTTKAQIDRLILSLNDPPKWIVYQRAPDTFREHEKAFGELGQLPHRALDSYILEKIANGTWSLAGQTCLDEANWIVIHTVTAERSLVPAPGDFPVWPAKVCRPGWTEER